jgi:hypothetical protein
MDKSYWMDLFSGVNGGGGEEIRVGKRRLRATYSSLLVFHVERKPNKVYQ